MDNDYVMISGILNSLRIRNSVVCRRFSGCSLYNDCRAESFVDKVCGTEKWVTHCLLVLKRFSSWVFSIFTGKGNTMG